MKIPYMDLTIQDPVLKQELLAAVERVFDHGRFILGKEVEAFEQRVAEISGTRYAVGVGSGTDALFLALKAMGIGPGDEVITSCLSFIATANAISLTGATPVFVDIAPDYNLDPDKLEEKLTARTRAILPVHYTGQVCRMEAIVSLAEKHGLQLLEDAAQAFGASYKGKKSGSFGRAACFSMNPMKVLAACGEAGAVCTNDQEIFEKVRAFRYNGLVNKYEARYRALNGRIDTLQAAMLLVKLNYLDGFVRRRREVTAFYNEQLKDVVARTPQEPEGCFNVCYSYNMICEQRDALQAHLEAKGIETKICFPLLMPQQPAYRDLPNGGFPNGEHFVSHSLSLPLHENITEGEASCIVGHVREFYGSRD